MGRASLSGSSVCRDTEVLTEASLWDVLCCLVLQSAGTQGLTGTSLWDVLLCLVLQSAGTQGLTGTSLWDVLLCLVLQSAGTPGLTGTSLWDVLLCLVLQAAGTHSKISVSRPMLHKRAVQVDHRKCVWGLLEGERARGGGWGVGEANRNVWRMEEKKKKCW